MTYRAHFAVLFFVYFLHKLGTAEKSSKMYKYTEFIHFSVYLYIFTTWRSVFI